VNSHVDPGVAFLTRLLALSEGSPGRTRPASLAPNYDQLRTAEAVNRFEVQMLTAQRNGAVSIRNGKRERRHLIERVTVQDSSALASHLGRKPAQVIAHEARLNLEPAIRHGEPWLVRILDEIESRWARGEAAFRLPSGEIEAAGEFLTLLAAISKDQARGLDTRTFSLRATGDTKSFDRHSTRIASVMAVQLGETGLNSDLIWSRIGLERFAHPVHLRGALIAVDDRGVLVDGRVKPFASIHPELLPLLRLSGKPSLILTIENYASFNRYVREINDSGLVLYTGGFASAGVIEILRWLLNNLEPSVPFFHWGDIDPGGLRIFRYLEEILPRAPRPHLMDKSLAAAHGKPASRDPTLMQICKSNSAIAGIAGWLASGDDIKHLEQEAIDPSSPPIGVVSETAA